VGVRAPEADPTGGAIGTRALACWRERGVLITVGADDGMLISAGTVLPGPAGERIDDGAVLVRGGLIEAVGPRHELEASTPAGVERVAHSDGTVLPGLIDSHVHLVFEPGTPLEEAVSGAPRDVLRSRAATHLRHLLDGGVTTARDLGDRDGIGIDLRDTVARGELTGPRLLVAGAPLTPPGGHCWFLGGEVAPDDPSALRAAVRNRAAAGVDVIKVMASGGQSTPGGAAMWERQFDETALRTIVEEATAHGLPVAAHAHGPDSIADATAAGVRTVEHCSWMTGRGTSDFREDVAEAMAARGVVACTGSSGRWQFLFERVGPERARELFGRMRRMADHGVTVLIGTDAGLTPFDRFGQAVANWGDWGFDPATMIEMVTTRAAEVLGLGAVTGRIAPGLVADLLLVRGDPTADLAALSAIELVVAAGAPHRPAT
jgi:imidazolonepropionase-like amidohydrolase